VDTQQPLDETTASPESASGSWLKRFGIIAAILLLLLVVLILHRLRLVSDKLQEAVRDLDRSDPGWQLLDIEAARQQVPDTENSALCIKDVILRLPPKWPPEQLDKLVKGTPPELLPPAEFTRLENELSPLTSALKAARKLAHLPYGRFAIYYKRNPMGTLLPDQQEARRVAVLLSYDVRRLAQAGQMKEAVQSCQAGLNVARSLGDEPFLVSQLIRFACARVACTSIEWALALGEPDPKHLDELQPALQEEDQANTLVLALRGERAALHQVFTLLETGEENPVHLIREVGVGDSFQDHFFPWKTQYDARAEHPLMLSLMNEQIEIAQKPLHEQIEADRALDAKVRELAPSKRLVRMLLPATTKVSDASRRHHAALRCQIALLAAERYRRAEGKWPESLDQLRPRFLSEVPLDPFDGKPVRYKRLDDGVIVYSVGSDGTDNSGSLDRENPNKPETDLGFQLWDVPRRRQMPKPKPPDPAPGGPAR
jgi:hypothetical protein